MCTHIYIYTCKYIHIHYTYLCIRTHMHNSYVTGFVERFIVHTSDFEYLENYSNHSEWYTELKLWENRRMVVLQSLKVLHLSNIPNRFWVTKVEKLYVWTMHLFASLIIYTNIQIHNILSYVTYSYIHMYTHTYFCQDNTIWWREIRRGTIDQLLSTYVYMYLHQRSCYGWGWGGHYPSAQFIIPVTYQAIIICKEFHNFQHLTLTSLAWKLGALPPTYVFFAMYWENKNCINH